MPRKKLEWTPEQIGVFKGLCGIMASKEEICQVMGHTPEQLEKLVNKHLREEVCGKASQKITFEEAFDRYAADGRLSIRRKQFEMAMAGDRSMLVWLGKQYLGQTDPDKGKPAKVQVETKPPSIQTLQSFRQRSPIARASGM